MTTKKGRKTTGRKYIKQRKKKKYEAIGKKRTVRLGEEKKKTKRTRGGNKKTFLLKGKFVNIQEKGKKSRVEIKKIIETPSNRFLARQNTITKGTIIETDLGKARITNRPSQEGIINGILIETE
ncbi:30S ribosomal protein S8e [Candidatus Pacearchaeota archaeon]|jgi:small subunit ribosomal protein S8e|nr:30S ribosomal protein S8e [Candidatus Pacearchaeota archaeon]|tara:strand:+ start:650 stop:1021 length:372 start_codon:yes stop_codon:yes gene_type:complete